MAAVLEDWRTAPVNERLRSTLGFLEKVTLSPAAVNSEDISALRSAGVSDRAIEEALYVCFAFNVMDRLADAFDFQLQTERGVRQNSRLLYKLGYRLASIPG